jgi:excisionase family DNA binding protein
MFLPGGDYLTIAQACRYVKRHRVTFWRWLQEHDIRMYRLSRSMTLVRKKDLQKVRQGSPKGRPKGKKDSKPRKVRSPESYQRKGGSNGAPA